jgi:diacylglycerol kinase family enzyme
MDRLWLITNPASGSASQAKCDAIEALVADRGLTLVGRTRFPADPLPELDALVRARVDTLVLFAGDGTINAAACALDRFDGQLLVLPGGTMNILAKALHGSADAEAIVHAAHAGAAATPLPMVEAGPHRGFCGVIVGPAASWGRAREALRARRLRRLAEATRLAWRRTFGRAVRVVGEPRLPGRHQALVARPLAGRMEVATLDTRGLADVARLGWALLGGDWRDAERVRVVETERLAIASARPVAALFDGEPVTLAAPVELRSGETRLRFVRTRAD